MNLPITFSVIALAALTFLIAPDTQGQIRDSDPGRWDLRMIQEAPVWQKLLVNYTYSDRQRFWPERQAALESVLEKYPDSRWADDAALLLACGRASLENNVEGAISDLQRVIDRYPDGQTVIDRWDIQRGCLFDEIWLIWQGGLVFLEPDGTVRTAKPFDRDGRISALEQEALAYFEHLEKYPRATSVTARLFIAEMQAYRGDQAGSIETLQELISDADAYLPAISRADRIAALRKDGYHIRNLVNRPEYGAYLDLVRLYEKQGQTNEAVESAGRFLERYSKDGRLWRINRYLAEMYDRLYLPDRAGEQYRLALKGLAAHEDGAKKRDAQIGGSDFPEDYWKVNRREIEEKLQKAVR